MRLWRLRRCSPESVEFSKAIALVLAATLCLAPVIWAMIYDQVMLIPGCFLLFAAARPNSSGLSSILWRISHALIVWTFVAIPIAALGESLSPSPAWMSLSFLGHLLARPLPLLSWPLLLSLKLVSGGRSKIVPLILNRGHNFKPNLLPTPSLLTPQPQPPSPPNLLTPHEPPHPAHTQKFKKTKPHLLRDARFTPQQAANTITSQKSRQTDRSFTPKYCPAAGPIPFWNCAGSV